MKKQIWKYPAVDRVEMLALSEIVHIGFQGGALYMWAEVDPNQQTVVRRFGVFGTGQELPENARHLHTWFEGPLVLHLYEVTV